MLEDRSEGVMQGVFFLLVVALKSGSMGLAFGYKLN